jgi:hypothetical protein
VKLELEKKYKDRAGNVWVVTEHTYQYPYFFGAERLSDRAYATFTAEGQHREDKQSDWDLVEEVRHEQRTTGLNLVEAYRAVKTGEWQFKRLSWLGWKNLSWFEGYQIVHPETWDADDFELRPVRKPLVLEAGKYYRTRDGRLAFVASTTAPVPTRYEAEQCLGWLQHAGSSWVPRSWSKTGKYRLQSDQESPVDLVRDLGTTLKT